jgi:hypothetical protein
MAKKKQFAGKETKLARLPLTQALASQAEEGSPSSPPSTPSLSLFTQLPLTWDEVGAGSGGPLLAAFLYLVRELADLKGALQSIPGASAAPHRAFLPDRVPPQLRLMQELRQARQSLRDLQDLLSQP